jgi:hypothetical protein
MAVRNCEKVGMRLTMVPVVCWGNSDARATGRKAARNEREGAAEMAAMVGDVRCAGLRCRDQWCSNRFLTPSFQSRTAKDKTNRLLRGWRRAADGLPRTSACPLSRAGACSQWGEREPGAILNPSLGCNLATPLQRRLRLLLSSHCKTHLRITFPVTCRALRHINTTSCQLPLSLIHTTAHIEAAKAEPNPPDPDTPLKHPHIPPTCPTPLLSSLRPRPHRASSPRATSVSTASPPRSRRSS